MDRFTFHVNDRPIEVHGVPANTTLLEWLRESARLTGTKEGCAEGDCGACTVLLLDPDAPGGPKLRAVNSCLVLLPMVSGRRVYTVEGLAADGPHPVQQAMAQALGSQCGYCTPGIVMSLAEAAHREDLDAEWKLDDQMCGNLCRCTGYRPIRDAARQVAGTGPDDLLARALEAPEPAPRAPFYLDRDQRFLMPDEWDALFDHLAADPEARIVAGGTDLSLVITKQHRVLPSLVSVEALPGLKEIAETGGGMRLGAALPLTDLEDATEGRFPPIHRMLRFFGARQIKHRATIGGNLCNASPIGDLPPVLLALSARVVLRSREGRRTIALDDFFTGYRRTALLPGEILEAIEVPDIAPGARAAAYKVSKRRELDISAVAGAFLVEQDDDGTVTKARIAYGGMAATPVRVPEAEAVLVGEAWTEEMIERAADVVAGALSPIDDLRASAWYRRTVAANLLRGFYLETVGEPMPALPDRPSATVAAR